VKLEHSLYEARFRAPFFTSRGTINELQRVCVRLPDDDGATGAGEVTPLPWYDGVDVAQVVDALQAWHPDGPLPTLPQAAAAIDTALWDLRGRRAGAPVWKLLGASSAEPVVVNATIAAEDRASAAAQAAQARAAGFTTVKLKVGLGDDAGRVAAVRAAAGPDMRLRLDANGAWSPEEAVRWLRVFEPSGIELCEEPVTGLEALAWVAGASPVPVALDETAAVPGALERRVADAICLKLARCGGISGLMRDAARARELGYEVYVASTLEGRVGIAAALHACAVVRPRRACGLATLALFQGADTLAPVHGAIPVPRAPGLG